MNNKTHTENDNETAIKQDKFAEIDNCDKQRTNPQKNIVY